MGSRQGITYVLQHGSDVYQLSRVVGASTYDADWEYFLAHFMFTGK